jgi:hypothetical protein
MCGRLTKIITSHDQEPPEEDITEGAVDDDL